MRRPFGVLAATAVAAFFALAAPAFASSTLYAAPGATGPTPCAMADPCQLKDALENIAASGDTVRALAGTYSGEEVGDPAGTGSDTGLEVPTGVTLRGAGSTTTTIDSGASRSGGNEGALLVDAGAVASDLRIEMAGVSGFSRSAITVRGLAERVFSEHTGSAAPGPGCLIIPGATIRDSVCWGKLGSGVQGGAGRLVGVTAVGRDGINVPLGTVIASNVIARGTSSDVVALSNPGLPTGTVTFDHSNYATTTGGGTVTPPGTGTNQTDDPLFTDAANGDFRPLPGSPVIDAGDSSAANIGSADVNGDSRVQGDAADIGAYEHAPATLYAAPGATGPTPCAMADPCQLKDALESIAASGDTVRALAGTYSGDEVGDPAGSDSDTGLEVPTGVTLRGAGSTTTTIDSGAVADAPSVGSIVHGALVVDAGAVASDVRIEVPGITSVPTTAITVLGLVERVFAAQTGSVFPGVACEMRDATIRDSVCWGSDEGVEAVGTASTSRLVGVTAVGQLGVGAATHHTTIASNMIARGAGADVADFSSTGGFVALDHSNYATTQGPGAVTPPGTGTNQTGDPLFTDAANGDFRPLPGSPVIDAGDSSASEIGSADVTGAPRVQQSSVDIGAYEFDPPPDTVIDSGPAEGETLLIKNATFSFSGDPESDTAKIQCKLDSGSFADCTSPLTLTGLARAAHTVSFRAEDAEGNEDLTPATRSFTVDRRSCKGRRATIVGAGTITGTPGDDVIVGTPGDDTIHGLGGDDLICALAGDDQVVGGKGADTLRGGRGSDRISGGEGADTLVGFRGGDKLAGGGGGDKLRGVGGADRLRGNGGADMLFGGPGDDLLDGGAQSDSCDGGGGTDTQLNCEG